MIHVTSYDVINGGKTSTVLCKTHIFKQIKDVDAVQKRAESIWNHRCSCPINVYIHYTNLNRHNPKSENIGKHDFRLEKWL